MCTKFYQNRLAFVDDMTKTFWCVFSVHSVDMFLSDKTVAVYVGVFLSFAVMCRAVKRHPHRLNVRIMSDSAVCQGIVYTDSKLSTIPCSITGGRRGQGNMPPNVR